MPSSVPRRKPCSTPIPDLHPAARILVFVCAALIVPRLGAAAVLAVTTVLALASLARPAPMLALLWRSRWLFPVIILGYAYSLPGTPAPAGLGDYAPTREGLSAGGLQALRLLALLLLLERLVLRLDSARLLAGLHTLFATLAGPAAAERLTVRLALTLARMRAIPVAPRTGLAARLEALFVEPAAVANEVVVVERPAWRWRDTLAFGLACLLLVVTWLPVWR